MQGGGLTFLFKESLNLFERKQQSLECLYWYRKYFFYFLIKTLQLELKISGIRRRIFFVFVVTYKNHLSSETGLFTRNCCFSLSHVHQTILNHNLSLKVVFLVLTMRCSQENEWDGFHPPGSSCSTLTLSLSLLYICIPSPAN